MKDPVAIGAYIFLIVVIVFSLLLHSCEHEKAIIEEYEHKIYDAEEKSYEQGYEEGEVEGYLDGYADGYMEGYDAGVNGEEYSPFY